MVWKVLPSIAAGVVLAASPSFAADTDTVASAIAKLNMVVSGVTWNASKARLADVTCDGKPDVILFGTRGNRKDRAVWIGVMPSGSGKPQTMQFPVIGAAQDGFAEIPTRISVYPLNCDTDAVGHLDGCVPRKGCEAFSLDSGETDPFNFFWDARRSELGWWRS